MTYPMDFQSTSMDSPSNPESTNETSTLDPQKTEVKMEPDSAQKHLRKIAFAASRKSTRTIHRYDRATQIFNK